MTTRNDTGKGSLPKLEELLAEIVNNQRLEQRLNLGHFLDWAIREKRASLEVGSFFLPIPASSSYTFDSVNPAGYVWIPHVASARVLPSGVITSVTSLDGQVFATVFVVSGEERTFVWQRDVPFAGPGAAKSIASITITNSELANKWVVGTSIGTYLLYTEWLDYLHDLQQYYPRDWRKY